MNVISHDKRGKAGGGITLILIWKGNYIRQFVITPVSRYAHSPAIWCGEAVLLVARIDMLLASDCIGCLSIILSQQ
jgi:hypothetical protein